MLDRAKVVGIITKERLIWSRWETSARQLRLQKLSANFDIDAEPHFLTKIEGSVYKTFEKAFIRLLFYTGLP